MSEERFTHVEKELDELYTSQKALEVSVNSLNVTIALLNQSLQEMKKEYETRHQFGQKVQFFVLSLFLSAAVSFVITGGLALK